MRKILGGAVLLAGVGGLSWWGSENQAERMEQHIRAQSQTIAAGAIHYETGGETPGVTTEVAGRDIIVRGLVDSEAERDALIEALESVEGQRVVRDETRMLEAQSPYVTQAVKSTDQSVTLSGAVPRETLRAQLPETSVGREDLTLAHGAPDNWLTAVNGGIAALDPMVEGTMRLEDQTMTITGLARDPATRDRALASIGALPEGYTLDASGIELQDDGTPPNFAVSWDSDGAASAMGKLPQGVSTADLAGELGRDAIDGDAAPGLMASEDGPAALAATKALTNLEQGEMRFDDGLITITGEARTPAERDALAAALSGLPEQYEANLDAITLQDDGTPPNFALSYDASTGATMTGKLPSGMTRAQVAEALGVETVGGDAEPGLVGGDQAEAALASIGALKSWLPIAEQMSLKSADGATDVDIAATPGAEAALVQSGLATSLPDADVSVVAYQSSAAEGDTRVNAGNGASERFSGGFWLPDVSFDANEATCNERSASLLTQSKVNFLSGSADLDPLSITTINRIAAIVQRCVVEGGLRAEIGGHTDSVGNANANYQLSFERARAVELALVDRGVPANGLQSVGHGDTDPIATNDTEEGRAANRRTTIKWTNIAQ